MDYPKMLSGMICLITAYVKKGKIVFHKLGIIPACGSIDIDRHPVSFEILKLARSNKTLDGGDNCRVLVSCCGVSLAASRSNEIASPKICRDLTDDNNARLYARRVSFI
jgi:hypothetical protein